MRWLTRGARPWAAAAALVVATLMTVPGTTATTGSGGAVVSVGDAPVLEGDVPASAVAMVASLTRRGLTVATATGGVVVLGDAEHHGEVAAALNAPVLAIAGTPLGRGYWLFARDGGVFTFGDAEFYGSTGDIVLNEPVVGAAATPSGNGYWLFARDGGVFTFGDARFFGSMGDRPLNQPVVAARATPSGNGYWLAARDGGVFTFGDAAFHGSTGDMPLNEPVVDVASSSTGRGYWLVARDGGVFTFGDAPFHGAATEAIGAERAALAIEPSSADAGYWVLAVPDAARIMVVGDVHGERQIGDQLRSGINPLASVAPLFREADAVAVNLETPAGSQGTPERKQYVFLAPPELLTALAGAGVDVVSLANNHAMDHGAATMLDTIRRARAAGLLTVGAGANAEEAFRPAYVDSRTGQRIAFVGLSRVVPIGWAATSSRPGVASAYDERASLTAIRAARAGADMVVVMIHWGVELARCPEAELRGLAGRLHEAGADVVAGHHPHVLQPADLRTDRATAYSLGNFVWYHNAPPSDRTAVFEVARLPTNELSTRFHDAVIGDDGQPRLTGATSASLAGC